MTVCQLYAKQIRHRANVRHSTTQGHKFKLNKNIIAGEYEENSIVYNCEINELKSLIEIKIEDKWNPQSRAEKLLLFIFDLFPYMDTAMENQNIPITADYCFTLDFKSEKSKIVIQKSDLVKVNLNSVRVWKKWVIYQRFIITLVVDLTIVLLSYFMKWNYVVVALFVVLLNVFLIYEYVKKEKKL